MEEEGVITMKSNNTKNGASSVLGAALVGAAVGATAVALAHEPTRKKVKESLLNAIEKGDQKLNEAKRKVSDVKKSTQKKAARELGKAQKKLSEGA